MRIYKYGLVFKKNKPVVWIIYIIIYRSTHHDLN